MLRALSGTEGEFEGERVSGFSLNWASGRMTGSAFARYELRGTFHMRVLRALSGIEGESEGERAARVSSNSRTSAEFFGTKELRFSLCFCGHL